jgi:hypothetical protein
MKIHPVRAKLFHVERQTDRQIWRSFTDAFRSFANAPKNWWLSRKRLTATGMHFVARAMRTSLAVFPRVSIGLSTWKPYWIPPCLRSGFHNLVNVDCRVWGMPAARGRVGRYFGKFWTFCTFVTSPRGCCLLQTRSHCADPKQISWQESVTGEYQLRDYLYRNTIYETRLQSNCEMRPLAGS